MPIVQGLSPSIRNLGLGAVPDSVVPEAEPQEPDVILGDIEANPLLKIENEDGSITISLDGKPVVPQDDDASSAKDWFRNLVEDIDEMELSRISNELLDGIQDDLDSRIDWVEDRAHGMRLLGLKIEGGSVSSSGDGAPVEGMSRVRHPLLLEAVLRFQANASAELLPTDGPVKVKVVTSGAMVEADEMAHNLEADLNYYLTIRAPEYYPDTDRMLNMLGFGGTCFKKVYFCPLRGRPISESVDAEDLIVNNAATTLEDARRVTHRVSMRPSTVRRMQILGVYRDVDLLTPKPADNDAVKQEKADQQGVSLDSMNPDDRDREIYECYCELDIKDFEHKHKGKETGLEIPYRVTIDVSSREILSITRNYDEPSGEEGDILPRARKNFVKYSFVPGMGFYDIGLLHILGNTTQAVTAMWREMLDAGMFANFPGALIADTGARQQTNIFRVPPGGAAVVKTGGLPISQAVMPLPYKEPGPASFNLVQSMVETGQRLGGTAELQVGEGRQDAPVGTTLAMIDQATKVMNSVHKRLHRAQAEEFRLLVRTFREHPDSFLRDKSVAGRWTEKLFVEALNQYDLTPQADPNTASQMQRQMKVDVLKSMQQANPSLYDAAAVDIAALRAIGWSNPEQFMVSEDKRDGMPPDMQIQMAQVQAAGKMADAKMIDAQSKAHLTQAQIGQIQNEIQTGGAGGNPADPMAGMELQVKQKEIDAKSQEALLDAVNRQRDRESRERLAAVRLAENTAKNPMGAGVINKMLDPGLLDRLENNEKPVPGTEGAY
jgi:hypothetical protein